ncbi:MAG TPA: hypothetical protein VHB70_18530 [Parafilimonas sp.]|nr:hypothetical protein [Parafilimonas sp.]
MQKTLFIVTIVTAFMSCTKSSSKISDVSQDSLTLTSITGDSADFSFVYTDGIVTDVLARHDGGFLRSDDSFYVPYAHLSYDSANYIKATSMEEENPNYDYTEYFLNEDKSPKKIIIHFRDNGAIDIVDFFYNPQTNLLDSVHDTNDGINFTSAVVQYDGADVSTITITYPYFFNGVKPQTLTQYTYDKSQPNVFKTLDPLWYVYKEPFGTYNYQTSWAQYNFEMYAKLFSQNTFTQIRSDYYVHNDWDTLQYTLNSAGKLQQEWYTSNPNYIRHYNYGN